MEATLALEELCIDFPFRATISHPGLDVVGMFELTRLLDFHEVRPPAGKRGDSRHELIVDVLSVKNNQTEIEVVPRSPMSYGAIATEFDAILKSLSKQFKTKVKVVALDWLVARKGMPSDVRSFHRRVV